jgi:hypothetical protein
MVMANGVNTNRLFLVRSSEGKLDLDRLARMRSQELQKLYLEMFACAVPAGNSEYARRKIGWHLQAQQEGALPEAARERALGIAKDARLRVRMSGNVSRRAQGLPLQHALTTHVVSDHDSRLPMPGSILVKKHKDRTIIVKILSSGFEYDGRRFGSLSAIANEITGTRWNGYLFFGLRQERSRGR